jgi:hypothetical protein
MTAVRSRNGSFKIIATLGAVLFMALFSACDVLATEGARSAIAGGREIREFEDENLRPIEQKMDDLWTGEIQPREAQLEDLRRELQTVEEDILRPLWDAQQDIWAPGGAASDLQIFYDEQRRELELMQRALEADQHDLDQRWQAIWNNPEVNTEQQALEDERYEKQRELDRLYRFGNRPIDELWDQINELYTAQNWGNTDSQIESEVINVELRRLYDLQQEIQNSGSDTANDLYNQANEVQNKLQHLYNNGRQQIDDMYREIERLESDQNNTTSTVDTGSIAAQIADIEFTIASYVANRDAEVATYRAELEAIAGGTTTDAAGNVIDTATETTTTELSAEAIARIAELEQLIADLNAQAEALVASKNAEVDALSAQIDGIKANYEQLVIDANADYEASKATLDAQHDSLEVQIAELEEIGGDDIQQQLNSARSSHDIVELLLQEEEDAHHALIDQYKADEDAELAGPKAAKDAVEAELLAGVTGELDAQIAVYHDELVDLQDSAITTTTTVPVSNTRTVADVEASIAASESHWNGLINDAQIKIGALNNELFVGSSTNDGTSDRINSLRLQVAEMEQVLANDISNLEALVEELYRQADAAGSGNTGQHTEIQRQIDDLNDKLNDIWAQDSSNGIDVLLKVQVLEKEVRILQDAQEEETYRLEEELWELDDRLSLYYRNQNNGTSDKEAAFQLEAEALQQRRIELDEKRWAMDQEQQIAFDEINAQQNADQQAIRVIEQETIGAIKDQMRAVELELREYYDIQRQLESDIRDAQELVEEKKRELEDAVFDALESAAGTVDEAGDTVLTATQESGTETPDLSGIEESDDSPVTTPDATADATAEATPVETAN